jgi:hypothetical protein
LLFYGGSWSNIVVLANITWKRLIAVGVDAVLVAGEVPALPAAGRERHLVEKSVLIICNFNIRSYYIINALASWLKCGITIEI